MAHDQTLAISQPLLSPLAFVGPQFVLPYLVDLTIIRKVDGNFEVTNVNDNVIFKIQGKLISLHDRRILLDARHKPILSFRKKLLTAHGRWQVFRGDSSHYKNLLFTAKQKYKNSLDVFLAKNKKEQVCDVKVKGSWLERCCTIYAGESTTILAEMQKKYSTESVALGKETFSVTVFPNVDYAFIVTLMVILDEINTDDSYSH